MSSESRAVPADLTEYRARASESAARLKQVAARAESVLERLSLEPDHAPLARHAAGVHAAVVAHASRSSSLAAWAGQVGDAFRKADAEGAGAAAVHVGSHLGTATKRPAAPPHVAIPTDFPDPSIIRYKGKYYAFGTGTGTYPLQVYTAPTLKGPWKPAGKPTIVKGKVQPGPVPQGFKLPAWAAKGQLAWAPDVRRLRNGTYILYYSVKRRGGHETISYATARSPAGPWKMHPGWHIHFAGQVGQIDPSLFVDRSTKPPRYYLVYKNNGNAQGKSDTLWVQQVRADGHTPIKKPFPTIYNHPGKNQVQNVHVTVEAPQIIKHGKEYVLFYSTGSYADSSKNKYTERYAIATSIHGPWTRSTKPLLQTGGDGGKLQGPGGATVDGSTIVFHNILSKKPHLVRQMWVGKLRWKTAMIGKGRNRHKAEVPYVADGTPP